MSFMEYDSPLTTMINKTVDIMILSLVWFVCCLPVVTIGASTTALYYATVKAIRKNRGYALKNFFHAFRVNLLPGTLLGIFFTLMAVILYVCFVFASALEDAGFRFFVTTVYMFMSFVLLGIGCFAFPVLSRCSMKCGEILRFSFGLLVKHFPVALMMVLIVVAAIYIMWRIPLAVFCIPVTASMLFSLPAEKVLHRYTPEDSQSWYS